MHVHVGTRVYCSCLCICICFPGKSIGDLLICNLDPCHKMLSDAGVRLCISKIQITTTHIYPPHSLHICLFVCISACVCVCMLVLTCLHRLPLSLPLFSFMLKFAFSPVCIYTCIYAHAYGSNLHRLPALTNVFHCTFGKTTIWILMLLNMPTIQGV